MFYDLCVNDKTHKKSNWQQRRAAGSSEKIDQCKFWERRSPEEDGEWENAAEWDGKEVIYNYQFCYSN